MKIWAFFFLPILGSYGLSNVEIQVPPSVLRGQPVTLNCTFDLDDDTLYSIKWLKNNVEFYRYIPSENPPDHITLLKGIYFESAYMHGSRISMYKTDLDSEGTYRCEVSLDAPFFKKVMDEKVLKVYRTDGIRMLGIRGPPSVMLGQPVTLNCTFHLDGDDIYSIEWYKNDEKFYRYRPSDKPPGEIYPCNGIFLSNNIKHGSCIRMYKTNLDSEGTYRCEVSTESSSFQTTVMGAKHLRVNGLPTRGPTISGPGSGCKIGYTVSAICMGGSSIPPSILEWRVNDKKREHSKVTPMRPFGLPDGEMSMLKLQFRVLPSDIINSVLSLKCIAFFPEAYSTTESEIVATYIPRIADKNSTVSHDAPIITGGRLSYTEKNVVNVNCTSAKSYPPAELRWYINNKEASHDFLRYSKPIRFPDGEESTVLGLRFPVEDRHFYRGQLRLTCVATLFKLTNMQSREKVISNENDSSVLEAVINRNGISNANISSVKLSIITRDNNNVYTNISAFSAAQKILENLDQPHHCCTVN